MAQDRFDFATSGQFPEVVALKARLMTRRLAEIHLHHTLLPDQALYRALAGPGDQQGETAGEETCRRIRAVHCGQYGWVDIAQHATIDPEGRIWIGRDWDLPPASARGQNGNATRGPFMLALVGNFTPGAERPTEPQLEAAAVVVAALQRAFGLGPDSLLLHAELDGRCNCPGQIDRAMLLKRVAAAARAPAPPEAKGPLGETQLDAYRLLNLRRDETGIRGAAAGFGDEAPTCQPGVAPAAALAGPAGAAAAGTRGGLPGGEAITPEMFRLLKPHVIHLDNGSFDGNGPYGTTRSDLQALVARIGEWSKAQAAPRVLVWAHGGLVSQERALAQAWRQYRWWLDSGIYPVFFIWETGALETALQLVENLLPARARGEAVGDWVVESLVHAVGRPFWRQMKAAAANAAVEAPDRGAHALAEMLAGLGKGGKLPELHAVGHSAGAIFHGNFLADAIGAHGLKFASLTLLAPACSVRFFDARLAPLIDKGAVARFRQFSLDRAHELADTTVPVYGKSLLYLISHGFEDRRGEPILGLEESIREDDGLVARFGLDGGQARDTLVLCPTPPDAAVELRSGAAVHGGFSQDPRTLEAIRADILGATLPASAPPAPEPAQARGAAPLYRSLRETHPMVFAALPAAPVPAIFPAQTLARPALLASPAGGRRVALSIAIDAYEGDNALAGCIADSNLWTALFRDLGFQVETLHDGQATRAGITAMLEGMIRPARPGDVLALHYSGHGTRLQDLDGDETGDNMDEAFVPIDALTHGEYLIDDDVRELFAALNPGVDFTFFADCCHSGTSTRFSIGTPGTPAAPRWRERYIRATPAMNEAHRQMRARQPVRRALPDGGQEHMTHLLFAACKDRQTAKESEGHGWFSRAATEVLRQTRAPLSNTELLRRIEQRFVDLGFSDLDQDPQLEGTAAARERAVLGGLK